MDDGAFSRLPKSVVATVLLALGGCGSAVPAPGGDATTGGGPAPASVTGQSPRPQAPTPGGTPPAAAPTRPGTPVPALRTPAVGDVDGDGRSDHLTLPSPGLVRVGYAGGRSDTVRFEAASEPGARLLGTQDADGDGRAEVFVRSTTGAATQFATVFRYVGGHLRVVTLDGAQTRLAYGGSVTHQDSWAAATLGAAGIQVLHLCGRGKDVPLPADPDPVPYVVLEYLDRMDLAYAAADAVVCRAGAGTVCEVTALGLPAAFVPLPIGNGEQEIHARTMVDAGGGLLVADGAVSPEWVAATVPGLITDRPRLDAMGAAASALIPRNADERLARIVLECGR